jgi:hypothetical protein
MAKTITNISQRQMTYAIGGKVATRACIQTFSSIYKNAANKKMLSYFQHFTDRLYVIGKPKWTDCTSYL